MRPTSAFLSGEPRTWCKKRPVGVVKYCHGVVVRGLSNALADKKFKEVVATVNGEVIKDWTCVNDRLIFKEPLTKGNYYLFVKVTYDSLEGVVYGYD